MEYLSHPAARHCRVNMDKAQAFQGSGELAQVFYYISACDLLVLSQCTLLIQCSS